MFNKKIFWIVSWKYVSTKIYTFKLFKIFQSEKSDSLGFDKHLFMKYNKILQDVFMVDKANIWTNILH